MNNDDKQRAQVLVNRLLNEARDKALGGELKASLIAVKKAKALDQTNVYLLALEHQLEQMQELALTGTLTDPQKADILGSVPRLVDQAIQSDTALVKPGDPHVTREETAEEREARIAAGRWLKNQYFQRAHEFVRTGEYDQALVEIRRIFTVDDQDKIAREFELKILQMLELRRRQPLVVSGTPEKPVSAHSRPEVQTQPERPAPEHSGRKISRNVMIAVIAALIVLSLAGFYFWKRHQTPRPVPQIREPEIEKVEEAPIYPVPPAQVLPDSSKRDTIQQP